MSLAVPCRWYIAVMNGLATENILLREFLRVSKDDEGRERSPDEQHDDHLRDAERLRCSLHSDPYREIGSASRYGSRARKDFPRLIRDLEDDTFGADGLALWEPSRGSRRVSEWANLVELLAETKRVVWVHSHARFYDPTNGRDRRSLIEDASDAEYESWKSSERIKRTLAARGQEGQPHGRIPFGYRREYEVVRGKRILIGQFVFEPEAPWVRELYARFLKGHSMWEIARDFARRGLRNDSGRPYSQTHLRDWLTNPIYAGWRIHVPGRRGGRKLDGLTVNRVDAQWPGLIPRKDWMKVQNILSSPSRLTRKPGGAKHLLSLIAGCDVCKTGHLTALPSAGVYRCRNGCVSINKAALDEFVKDVLLEWLSTPERYEQLLHIDGDASERLVRVREQIEEIQAELDELADQVGAGKLSAALAARSEPKMRTRLTQAEAEERGLVTPAQITDLINPGEDAEAAWEDAPISTQREFARLVFEQFIGVPRVMRSPVRGHRVPVEDRVRFVFPDEAASVE